MAQKFVSLDEAAAQLGITKDRLNELREDNKIRAYRDGASWKFRAEDVEKLATDGVPASDASSSDLSLDLGSLDLDAEQPAAAELSSLELDLGEGLELGSEIELDASDDALPSPAASDLSLDDLDEPTLPVETTADADDDVIGLGDDLDNDDISDSILLSENELGESTDRPPSTIIGKAELAADMDLELGGGKSDAAMSDVRLADAGTSNVFSVGTTDDVLDSEPPGLEDLGDQFDELDELEIDLEAESSRILAPEDVAKAQLAAKEKADAKAAEMSDLELASSDSSPSGVLENLAGEKSDIELAGLSALELDDDDDDDVLGEGSDITLSSGSSGINIISPSDSGLSLDKDPLGMGSGSPMASGLDLGGDDEAGLEPLEVADGDAEEEPFALTPFGEESSDDEEDSSQVIPLDAVEEEGDPLGVAHGIGEDESIGDGFETMGIGQMVPAGEAAAEVPFSGWHIAALAMCMLMMVMGGMMVFDLVRNMWSWGEVYTLNSSLMDVLTPILG